jgi:signal transduction histidine kinase/ActR/RegA family two-component response regulator
LSIWRRIDGLTGSDPRVDLSGAVNARIAFTYSVILSVMAMLNAMMLQFSGDGRPGMVLVGVAASAVALGSGVAGIVLRRPNVTMVLILVFAVALYIPSAWGNRGFLPPSAIYIPGVLMGFYLVWGWRCLILIAPLTIAFLVYIHQLATDYPATADAPMTAMLMALGFACIWVIFIGSIFRSANEQASAQMRQTNSELAAALEAVQASSQAKSEFLANMGHEVRTPLNGVLGMTKVLLNEGDLTPRQRERLELIDVSGGALHDLLNDILDLSRVQAGRLELARDDFCLSDLVRGVAARWQDEAVAKGLKLEVSLETISVDHLCGDPVRLRQVLDKLVGNAVKFTSVGRVDFEVDQPSDANDGAIETRFRVRDTGPGIGLDQQAAIFETFSQADTSATRRYGGSGLGLAVSRHLAEEMGTHIRLESRPGEGAMFEMRLQLPVASTLAEPAEQPADAKIRANDAVRILVVDDVATNQIVLKALIGQYLDAETLVIDLASSGREAINAVAAKGYDLVLMDIQMPEMDGVTAMRCMREVATADGMRIAAVTALASPESERALLDDGFCDYLPKPVTSDTLRELLTRAFDTAA